MSGIYIPGVALPESCGMCDTHGLKNAIWHFGFGCNGDIDDFANCPPARYPLIPVPDHGRLIDADALKKTFAETVQETYRKEVAARAKGKTGEVRKAIHTRQDFIEAQFRTLDAPTIIPADKEVTKDGEEV